MSAQLDIDDACSPHPVAKSELDQLRAENAELRAKLDKKTKLLQQGWIELCNTGISAFKEENDELRRLIRDVAIPALDYSAKSWIGAKSSDPVRTGLNTLREAMK